MHKYPKEEVDIIIDEYINGKSIYEISDEYKIHETTIRKWLSKKDVPNNGTGRFYQKYVICDDYAEMYIKSKGSYIKALIDIEDVEKCKNHGIWSISKNGYIINCKSGVYLHRFVMNCPSNIEVDHEFHNTLDNRKSKLRLATSSQQKMNTHIRKDNKSGHRGVYYDKQRNTWNVHLKSGNRRITKRFKEYEDAVLFCEEKMKEIQGDFQYKEVQIS